MDTIVCDLKMPKVNGMEAIACFRKELPSVPLLVLTGHPDVENIGTLMKQSVVDYLVKPAQAEKLAAAVGKVVKGHELFTGDFSHGR